MKVGDLVTLNPESGIKSWNAWRLAPPEIAKLLAKNGGIAMSKATQVINIKQDQLHNTLCEIVQQNTPTYAYVYLFFL